MNNQAAPIRNTVISVRVDDGAVQAIDLLVRAGLAQSRSEAAAQFVAMGIASAAELLVRANRLADHLQQLKSELLAAIRAQDVMTAREVLERDPELLRGWGRADESGGVTPVLLSVYAGATELTQLLIERGAETDVFEATAIGDVNRVRQLLDADPGLIGARSHDGWTPLHMAAYFGHADVAQLLLERGASLTARSANELGNTPLHSALAGRRYELVELLGRSGADVNALNARGWAPLHHAACTGNAVVVEWLLQNGAQPSPANRDGLTPGQLARERGYGDIADRLERAEGRPTETAGA